MSSASDELRQAAETLRERATAATREPWVIDSLENGEHGIFVEGTGDGLHLGCGGREVAGFLTDFNATYIATMHPELGLLLADWLDDAAAWEATPLAVNHDMRAHDVARLINGGRA